MEIKYDVFISYSRRDYVDENKNIVEGNVISVIKQFLEDHGISYWIDEEGDLTGKKFANIIAKAIRESLIFLFVCTKVANLEKRISSLASDLSHNQGYMMVELK